MICGWPGWVAGAATSDRDDQLLRHLWSSPPDGRVSGAVVTTPAVLAGVVSEAGIGICPANHAAASTQTQGLMVPPIRQPELCWAPHDETVSAGPRRRFLLTQGP